MKFIYLIALLFIFGTVYSSDKPNVLMIVVDDLRADLQQFSSKKIHRPAMDRLASESVSFKRAYCQKALCVPSRQSFLTGLRPDKFGAGFNNHFRKKLPNHVTLPQLFKKNGYETISIGKVFHHRDRKSWSEASWVPKPSFHYPLYASKEAREIQQKMVAGKKFAPKGSDWWAHGGKWAPGFIWDAAEVNDSELTDGKIADYAISKLKLLKNKPFFMAVGFFRPHLPFIAPQKYFDLYPMESIKLPINQKLPFNVPEFAAQTGGEWRSYYGISKKGFPNKKEIKEYIRAYLASVAYVDAQIGRVLQSLKDKGVGENTVVVLLSDHGYHLFDMNSFGKSTNFEDAVRVPFMIKSPKYKSGIANSIIELVDLYPTLAELAGLETPSGLDGQSFVNVLKGSETGKSAAYSQYSRKGFKGYSVRTDRFRFTQWIKGSKRYQELYDFTEDPSQNVADQEDYADYIKLLRKKLSTVF